MVRTGFTWVILISFLGCGQRPADRLLGAWEAATNDPMREAAEAAKLPMGDQRTVFRYLQGNVSIVEHWFDGELMTADTNWYHLSPDGDLLTMITPRTADTMRILVNKLTSDTLVLGPAPPIRPWMILVRKER